jgi:hypothetical protein
MEERMNRSVRVALVALGAVAAGVLIAFYVVSYLLVTPPTLSAASSGAGTASLTLQTVAAFGSGGHPDWVSYLAQDPQGNWVHTTYLQVPANSLVKVTIYQYDTGTGLRNPFFTQVRGTEGSTMAINGKSALTIDQADAAHTFAVPDLGISVPLKGVDPNAKNQCTAAPCDTSMAHNTITFSFRTGAPGTYRWQCFVPCAAGNLVGNGGPMQTLGYMGGFLNVV